MRLPAAAEAPCQDVQARLDEVQAELSLLRRTLVAALAEVKEKVAELGPQGVSRTQSARETSSGGRGVVSL